MSTVHHVPDPTRVDHGSDRASRHGTRTAWWALATVPVAFVAATLLGSWLLLLQGVDLDADETPSIWQALLAGLPATGVLLLPVVLALHLVRGHDERSARLVRVVVILLGVWILAPLVVAAVAAAVG